MFDVIYRGSHFLFVNFNSFVELFADYTYIYAQLGKYVAIKVSYPSPIEGD